MLFYGPTHKSGGVAENLVNNSPGEFYPIGSGSEIWTPGDSNLAIDWSRKTTADFAAFDAIVIGDPGTELLDPQLYSGAIVNRATWTAAVSDNVLVIAGDPQFHADPTPGFTPMPGAEEYIEAGVRFAADDPSSGPGLYVATGFWSPNEQSPVDPSKHVLEHLLESFGAFDVAPGMGEEVFKINSHPVLDCVTDDRLSNWDTSSHEGFHDWPAAFVPLALVTDLASENNTPANKLPLGVSGLVHILARGNFEQFTLTPFRQGRLLGQQHTVTATYLSPGGAPNQGATVTFTITGGPNQGLSAVRTTDTNGKATWSYTGTGGSGEDTIEAVVSATGCAPSARAFCDWSDQLVTIVATDPDAAEPVSGGPADTGTFTISRTGSTGGSLNVPLEFLGTANQASDYGVSSSSASFGPGQTSATVTVTPFSDSLSEVAEIVVGRIQPNSNYAIGSPSEATVTITSAQVTTVTLTVVDSTLDETGDNPGKLRLNRTDSSGNLQVQLGFSGTASFGSDYDVDLFNFMGIATIPHGSTTLDVPILPIPDSRAEGTPGETVITTILPAPNGDYEIGSPDEQTLTILEDDDNQFPANGWKVIDLGTVGGSFALGMGINTLPDGAGGWRGQVVGYAASVSSYDYLAFKWDNGSVFYRYPASGMVYNPWSQAFAINDNCTIVGNYGEYIDDYYYRPCFWHIGQTYATMLPVLNSTQGFNTAVDINERNDLQGTGGVIVGTSRKSNGKDHAVAWIPNSQGDYTFVTDLNDTGSGNQFSYAHGINNLGVVVGRSQIQGGNNFHAFRSDSFNLQPVALNSSHDMGTATMIDSHSSEANDINDLGELVGSSHSPSGQYQRAVYKAPGTGKNEGYYDLGVLNEGTAEAGNQSVALAINEKGIIIGQSTINTGSTYSWRAFVISNEGNPGSQPMLHLAEQSWVWTGRYWQRADANGWEFSSAEAINREGWIAGFGKKGGQTHAFVLSPR